MRIAVIGSGISGLAVAWLRPDGRVFLHVFSHRSLAYLYEDRGASDWMARHFFTGGLMPSHDLPRALDSELGVERQWRVDGRHYSRTLEAWLGRLDLSRRQLLPLLEEVYGGDARRWLQRWRIFFMACSELFAFDSGREWGVSHFLLAPRREVASHPATAEPAA